MENAEQFSVVQVLKGSYNIIREKPIILLHQLVIAILLDPDVFSEFSRYMGIDSLFYDTTTSLLFAIVYVLLVISVPIIIDAMYPLVIRDIIDKKEVDFKSAFTAAKKKFFSVLGAVILVGMIVVLGLILLIIPGLIFFAWYFYTIPAIMLHDVGASVGMEASKQFARDKKLKTLLLYITPFLLGAMTSIIFESVSTIPEISWVINFGISLLIAVWIAVIPAYAYIRFGGSYVASTNPFKYTHEHNSSSCRSP